MKIMHGIAAVFLILSSLTILPGAWAYDYSDFKYISGESHALTPAMKISSSSSSGSTDISSTPAGTTGITGDSVTGMVNGLITTILIVVVVVILIIVAVVYFIIKKAKSSTKPDYDEKF